jgi:hypothetical protein
MSNVLTPFCIEGSRLRAHLMISDDDMQAFDALDKDSDETVDVFDEVSQAMYRIKRADCGAGCRCAARIVEQLTGTFGVDEPIVSG